MESVGSVSLAVSALPLASAWRSELMTDLLAGRPEPTALYAWPLGADCIDEALQARRAQPWRAPAADVAAALRERHEQLGMTAAIDASLCHLEDPETVVVVTGQQPGLLGGPLYTYLKALTVVVEAERLRARGLKAVPLFWVASEDDDLAEVRSAWLFGPDGLPREHRLELAARPGESVGPLVLPAPALEQLFADLADDLPQTEFSSAVAATMASCWEPGARLGEAFARWLIAHLGDRGLVILDPMTPRLRALGAPLLRRVLDDPLLPTRLANQVGERLHELGYDVPTHRPAGLCAFYLYQDGVRQRLWFDGDGVVTGTGDRLELTALRERLVAEPERFSTSLLLRPVLQDYLLNTALFVVGPGEIGYGAQVGPIYDAYDVARPLLFPRYSATIVEPRIGRYLDSHGLAVPDVWAEPVQLLKRMVREESHNEPGSRFDQALATIRPAMEQIRDYAAGVDPSLAGAADSVTGRLASELGKLQQKVERALRQQNQTLQRRVEALSAQLYPNGQPQERVLALAGFEAKFGPSLLGELSEALAARGRMAHVVARIES